MRVDTLRERFAEYLQEKGLDTAILLDASLTVGQDSTLKYERIDKYRVLHVRGKELDGLMRECSRLGLCLWLGAGKLCIGYEHRGNTKLSAFGGKKTGAAFPGSKTDFVYPEDIDGNISVLPEVRISENQGDRNISVPAGSAAAVNLEDRKLYDEQHGAVSTPVPPPINSVFIEQERCQYCGIGLPSFEGAGMVQYTCSCGKTIQLKAHTMQEFKVSFTG